MHQHKIETLINNL